ncbi:(deoxy)nucleoside triphosphate pyrophosphohydrolase [Cardiobacterium valvarum]|uniref:8-oxo-dGTP diphosphatase n=1 Tax=Cardiobacterium valvarum TaxID=194702 RepID=A0A381E9T1_9GAMM|nr:(deoxy)nucleoside triphosphate pyrophosphohydrolase [Cardiobacterium valvarum]SUX23749.1 CTP pyrophosphohydrolase [Cardiobacterium valvarum]
MIAPIAVVAAIIENRDSQLLIAERPPNKNWAGYWEFPGGKIEAGESHEAALIRELREELGLDLSGVPLRHYYHGVRGAEISIDFYHCRPTSDLQPQSLEGQRWRWVARADLGSYRFPEPNTVVLQKLMYNDT